MRSSVAPVKNGFEVLRELRLDERLKSPPIVALPLLIRHFVAHFAKQYGRQISGLTPRAEIVLGRHVWPGNVRELENVIGHACMMASGDRIDLFELPTYLRSSPNEAPGPASPPAGKEQLSPLDEQECRLISEALTAANGNQSEAARILKIDRDALRYKMKTFAIEDRLAWIKNHRLLIPGTWLAS